MLLLIFIFGAIVGSFLNVVIMRTHSGGVSWTKGRSHCPHCRHTLQWADLIPIFSYVLLCGRCRYCRKHVSLQYPLVEGATALLFCLAYIMSVGVTGDMLTNNTLLVLGRNMAVISVLMIIFVYDLRWQLILDRITLPAIGFFFVVNGLLLCESGWICPVLFWTDYALGAILGGGFFLIQYVISKGKWIGGGDIRLGALMGVILGLSGTAIALFISYMIGAVCGIVLILLNKKKMGSSVPFGTFLSIGTLIVLLWQAPITSIIQRYLLIQ